MDTIQDLDPDCVTKMDPVDTGKGTEADPLSAVKNSKGVIIKEELDVSDAPPAATSLQPHLWLPAKDEPTSPSSESPPLATLRSDEDVQCTSHQSKIFTEDYTEPLSQEDPLDVVVPPSQYESPLSVSSREL